MLDFSLQRASEGGIGKSNERVVRGFIYFQIFAYSPSGSRKKILSQVQKFLLIHVNLKFWKQIQARGLLERIINGFIHLGFVHHPQPEKNIHWNNGKRNIHQIKIEILIAQLRGENEPVQKIIQHHIQCTPSGGLDESNSVMGGAEWGNNSCIKRNFSTS